MTRNMPTIFKITLIPIVIAYVSGVNGNGNLSCYQCTKTVPNEKCSEEELLPCPSNKDRCVTTISKDPVNGYKIKRECGLFPCGFEDVMVSRGLGLDKCDTKKDDIFCVFCCKENGCNAANSSYYVSFPIFPLFVALVVHVLAKIHHQL